MWEYYVIALAVALVVGVAFQPKIKSQTAPPAGIQDIQAPTAQEGLEIPVLFGCRELRGPNVVWYGDLRTTAIKSESGGKK